MKNDLGLLNGAHQNSTKNFAILFSKNSWTKKKSLFFSLLKKLFLRVTRVCVWERERQSERKSGREREA